jgi:tetratricopeptide (TPR) repeat protein
MARLDSLGPAKETAQLASVLGRTFHHDVLSAVSAAETERVDAHIGSLLEAGLLEDVVSPPDGTYRFRQSLVQETAYESLLRSRRRELHGHVANVLSERFRALTGSEPETLARHCEAAGRWRDALDSYRNAGNRGVERGSYVEAIAIFQKSVELLDRLEAGTDRDRLELALLQQAVMPIFAHHGYAASELPGIYARIGELTRALGGSREEAWQLVAAWGFHLVRCDRLETQDLAERMKELAKHAPEVLGDAQLGYVLGYNAFYAGDQVRAQAELERALQPGEGGSDSPVPAIEAAFHCSLARGWSLAVTGEAEPAWQSVSASVAAAEAVGQPFAIAQALAYQSAVAQETGREPREVQELAERLLKIATEQDLTIWICFAHIFRGWARAMQREEDGVDELRDAIEASLAGGHLTSMGHSLLLQASALQHLGRSEEALRTADEALAFAADHLERFSESDAMRVRSELLWGTGDRDAAEDGLRTALETASKQGARLFALRAATSLARLLHEKDRTDEGRACLAPWVSGFPDGLPGPWLREAKELLSHLGGAA